MSRFCERIFWPAGPSSLSEFPDALGAGETLAAQSLAKPQSRKAPRKQTCTSFSLRLCAFAPLREKSFPLLPQIDSQLLQLFG